MSCLPKPEFRGYLRRYGLKLIVGGMVFSSCLVLSVNFFHKIPRRKAYEEYWKTYDAESHGKDLSKWGYFDILKKTDI